MAIIVVENESEKGLGSCTGTDIATLYNIQAFIKISDDILPNMDKW